MPKLQERIYSLDCEATGLDLMHGARPFFVSMCDQDNNVYSWPTHEDGPDTYVDPLTRQPHWSKSDLLEIEAKIEEADKIVLQNPKFDVHALRTIGIDGEWPWHKTFDTLMAGHLLCSNQPHDLTTMAMIYLRLNIQPLEDKLEVATKEARKIARHKYPEWQLAQEGLASMPSFKGGTKKDKKGNVKEDGKKWKYDSWLPRAIAKAEGYPEDHDWWHVLADYGNGDSAVTLPLFLRQEQLLVKQGLWKIYLEGLKLLPVIYQMESNGMTMSSSRLKELYTRLSREVEECRTKCIDLADGEIEDLPVNGMSNALRYVLFEKFALKSSKKTDTGKPSGDKFVLDHWLATLPEVSKPWQFVSNLRKYRKRKTAIGYLDSYQKFWLPISGDTMIVYPSYNSTGSDTLRFSSQNPNAQQVSKQEDVNLRYAFGPSPDKEWWSKDFQNLELRIPAYKSNETDLIWIFEHPDDPPYYGSYHLAVCDLLYPEKFAQHGKDFKKVYATTYYQWVKNGNFATIYGAQQAKADETYHVRGAHAKIRKRFPSIAKLADRQIEYANKYGYVETFPDRSVDPTRGYPLWCSRTEYNKISPTVPLNYTIQGTAMWLTRRAMVRCHEYLQVNRAIGGKLICQVHDEIIFEFPRGKDYKTNLPYAMALKKLMEQGGYDVGVPTPVSCTYHATSWAEGIAV